jgi:signal transduction histidine kinase
MNADQQPDEALLREVLRTLSHDLRNPLAAVVTNLEFAQRLLAKTKADPDLAEALADSTAACAVLRRIIANLDVMADDGKLEAGAVEQPLAPICHEAVNRCRGQARQKEVSLAIDDGGDVARGVLDRNLFALAVENLLCNALQHAPTGSTARLVIRPDQGGGTRVSVLDQGGAVPESLRALAVSRAGNTTRGRAAGSRYARGGTLLAARQAVAAMGITLAIGGQGEHSELSLIVPAP